MLCAAAALAGGLVAASVLGAREDGSPPAPAAAPSGSRSSHSSPGSSSGAGARVAGAPVTLVEYADLQCPYCARWARDTLPTLVGDYVRAGRLRIVFHGLAFIGSDSDTALRTAVAAGPPNRFWDVVHGFYANQGAENAGWVTDTWSAGSPAACRGWSGKSCSRPLGDSRQHGLERFAAAARAAGDRRHARHSSSGRPAEGWCR